MSSKNDDSGPEAQGKLVAFEPKDIQLLAGSFSLAADWLDREIQEGRDSAFPDDYDDEGSLPYLTLIVKTANIETIQRGLRSTADRFAAAVAAADAERLTQSEAGR